jgi:hypothetical protein
LSPAELEEYEQTLAKRDENYWFAEYIWKIGRKIDDVYTVGNLLDKVATDVKRAMWCVYLNRPSSFWRQR